MIAVLLPTYNQAAFLPDAIAGLDAQTRTGFELIACDDGSTDDTSKILKDHGVRTVTHETNRGTAAAINSAAELAGDAKYLTWVSSDNVMYPNWLATLAAKIRGTAKCGAVYSAFRSVQKGGGGKLPRPKVVRSTTYSPLDLIAGENCYFGPSFLIRREVWQEHRGGTAHDYDNWTRVEEACWARGWTLAYVNEVLCDYRHGEWNTVRRHPERYDAERWRDEALARRRVKRNWLGDLVAARVRESDEVLDLGCGIMPATGGRLACKRHVGVDGFQPYLDRIGPPYALGTLPAATSDFRDRSFDVVLLLDVVEHLDKPAAMALIREAERIARREVILFTPDGPCPQAGYAAWGMGENEAQAHRCSFTFDELASRGFDCTRYPNGTEQNGAMMAVFGVKRCD